MLHLLIILPCLVPAPIISGRVLDADGQPIAGAVIHARTCGDADDDNDDDRAVYVGDKVSHLMLMDEYCRTDVCRHAALAFHFGQGDPFARCGTACDVCKHE